jgi:hypothetical protein
MTIEGRPRHRFAPRWRLLGCREDKVAHVVQKRGGGSDNINVTTKPVDLSAVDGRLLDGLDFCREVYDTFDAIRKQPDGIARLRLLQSKTDKRLIEELIPIARYVQARYREGRRIKVRWLSGSQRYDAILWSSGGLVTHRMAPKRVIVEVTSSMHENEHRARRLLHTEGGSFGVKDISRDKKTGVVSSRPHVSKNDEIETDLAGQILTALNRKTAKSYPRNTVLIIRCVTNGLTLDTEWAAAIRRVENARPPILFREVFLLETVSSYTTTLYGDTRRW